MGALLLLLLTQLAQAAPPQELTLPQAITQALSGNRNLVASQLSLEGDRYQLESAHAEFHPRILPTVTVGRTSDESLLTGQGGVLSSSYGVQLRKRFALGTTVAAGPNYNVSAGTTSTTLNVVVNQPLLKGFGTEVNLDAVHRAEFSVVASTQGYEQSRIDLALDTINLFYEALRQKEIADINKSLSERLRQHVLLTTMKEKRGLTGPMDTYRAVIRLKDAEDTVAQSQNAYLTVLDRLRWNLNLDPGTELTLKPENPPELGVENPESDGERRNTKLLQLRNELDEAGRSARVADNATLPDIGVQLNYNHPLSGPLPSTLPGAIPNVVPGAPLQRWSVSLQGSTDLFHGAEKSSYERARVRAEALTISLEHKTADVRRQIRQQLQDIAAAKERIGLREAQIKEAEGKLALAKVKFSNDMADNFDVMESETELQRARVSLAGTRTDYALGVYTLKAVTGHLLDPFRDVTVPPRRN